MATRGSATLGELMGDSGDKAKSGLSFDDLPKLLGEGMPDLQFHALGRIRLVRALRNRFGQNYRSIPGINDLMKKFDSEAHIELTNHKIKQKFGRKDAKS